MAGSIGIKQANGDFYSILDENSAEKKRLVLTTVHDNQKSVQIDLYRSLKKTMADAMYIGSIVVENISQKLKGEPSIEMTLSSEQDGSISAHAVDLGNPENEHHLSVSLKSFEEDKNEYSDFDFESEPETSQKNSVKHITSNRKFPWLVVIIIGFILVLLCLGLWFFLFRNRSTILGQVISWQTSSAVAVQKQPEPSVQKTREPEQEAVSLITEQALPQQSTEPAPASPQSEQQTIIVTKPPQPQLEVSARQRPSAPVYSYSVPQTIPPEGIAYKIRWGDTLWDISEAFYRNPRLYPFIVRSNGIRNPNLIVSGMELNITPRN